MAFLSSDESCGSLDELYILDEDEAPMKTMDSAVLNLMSHTPLYQGYLFKESSFHKAFNKRYFVLYQDLLVYYKEEDQFLKRSTPEARLKHCSSIIYLEGCYLTKPKTLPYGARFCFILHVPHKNNRRMEIKLVSKTKHDKHMWISMLQAQNPRLVCQPSTTTHSFRQAIEKSHSFSGSIDSYHSGVMAYASRIDDGTSHTYGNDDGLTFTVGSHDSHHLHATPLSRSMSACYHTKTQVPIVIQHSISEPSENQ